MSRKLIVTYVPGVINELMLKKDPVCIPYGFARLGFRSLLVCGRAWGRAQSLVYEAICGQIIKAVRALT